VALVCGLAARVMFGAAQACYWGARSKVQRCWGARSLTARAPSDASALDWTSKRWQVRLNKVILQERFSNNGLFHTSWCAASTSSFFSLYGVWTQKQLRLISYGLGLTLLRVRSRTHVFNWASKYASWDRKIK
jgi:hypothetical protein